MPKNQIITGAEQTEVWLPYLKNKKVALLVNHTAIVENQHLVDTMLALNIDVRKIFLPEHGFRGDADAGEQIKDGNDKKTGIPLISIYGNSKKPTNAQMKGLDVVVFDIQDVGVRFFTYISSMHYMMEACAENNVQFIIFDRPNPNGDYIDGPILKKEFSSFVGMHPIPVVHGMTVGELAQMINAEGWLSGNQKCSLIVIPNKNYSHQMHYSVPKKPSPNLPNDLSIRLYPSLCFFEGTEVSIGRGTYFPFQVIGFPDVSFGEFSFTPVSIAGMAKQPLQEGKVCYGSDLRNLNPWEQKMTLEFLLEYYKKSNFAPNFISRERFFNLLAGTDQLLKQIKSGMSENEIRKTWENDLKNFDEKRKKYLLYE
ncbi:MAG: DUF1343 domain-containing protein [Marinilabiliaceae bacterium]|nr:DUF1343 domain-containing protein [Marinilabiliaceae bacterium]